MLIIWQKEAFVFVKNKLVINSLLLFFVCIVIEAITYNA